MHYLEPNNFYIGLILKLKLYFYFKNKNIWWLFGIVESAEFKSDVAEQVRQ